jgi:hypothetical protein
MGMGKGIGIGLRLGIGIGMRIGKRIGIGFGDKSDFSQISDLSLSLFWHRADTPAQMCYMGVSLCAGTCAVYIYIYMLF